MWIDKKRDENKMFLMKKNALFYIRKKMGLTQKQVAELVNTTPGQIFFLETGERKLSPEWLDRLSKALGCTKAELLGETPTLSREDQVMLEYFRRLPPKRKERYLRNLREEIEDLEETEAPEKAKEKAG